MKRSRLQELAGINVPQLLVLGEDGDVIVTTLDEYNDEEGYEYSLEGGSPVDLETAKSYGNGSKEWEDTLDTFAGRKFMEIEPEWGEGALIAVI